MDIKQIRQRITEFDISDDMKIQILALSDDDLIKAVSDCNGAFMGLISVLSEMFKPFKTKSDAQGERVFPNYKSSHKSFAGAIKRDNTPMPEGMKEFLEYKRCNLIAL